VHIVDLVDSTQRRRRWLAFPLAVLKKFSDDQGGNLAAMLAFYAFLAVFPLVLLLSTVLGFVLQDHPELRTKILHSALVEFPVIGEQLRTAGLQGHWYVVVVSALFSLWGAQGVANAAQNAFNTLWEVPYARRPAYGPQLARSLGLLSVMGVAVIATGLLSGIGSATGSLGITLRVLAYVASAIINIAIFLVGFRLSTARDIELREMWLGAVISALVWQALLAVGTLLVAHQVRHAQELYGTFGIVLGLLAWLRLQAQLTLYAIEADVVRVRRLWPRSLAPPPLTGGDQRALQAYAEATRRLPKTAQSVEVSFPDPDTAGDPEPGAG